MTQMTVNTAVIVIHLTFGDRLFVNYLILLFCKDWFVCRVYKWARNHGLLQVCNFSLHRILAKARCLSLYHLRVENRAIMYKFGSTNRHFTLRA